MEAYMEEMVIFSRTYDLLTWLLPHCERFPAAQRFVVTKRSAGCGAGFPGDDLPGQCPRGSPAVGAPAGRGCAPEQTAAISPTGAPVGVALVGSVRACQQDGSRSGPVVGRVDQTDVQRMNRRWRRAGAPGFCMRLTRAAPRNRPAACRPGLPGAFLLLRLGWRTACSG